VSSASSPRQRREAAILFGSYWLQKKKEMKRVDYLLPEHKQHPAKPRYHYY
jgi:hypothetical protein